MASRDCHPSTTREAKVVAILTDDWGNPVTTGEDISFTISGISTAPNDAIPGPSFESGSEIHTKTIPIDNNGNAILAFYPGAFIQEGQPGYLDLAWLPDHLASGRISHEYLLAYRLYYGGRGRTSL